MKARIIIAIVSTLGLIIVAFLQFYPWNKIKPKKEYILSGTVVDDSSNASIVRAEITLVGRNEQYYTEQNGNFKIIIKDSIPSVRIRVTKEYYNPYDKSYDLPNESLIIPLTETKGH